MGWDGLPPSPSHQISFTLPAGSVSLSACQLFWRPLTVALIDPADHLALTPSAPQSLSHSSADACISHVQAAKFGNSVSTQYSSINECIGLLIKVWILLLGSKQLRNFSDGLKQFKIVYVHRQNKIYWCIIVGCSLMEICYNKDIFELFQLSHITFDW